MPSTVVLPLFSPRGISFIFTVVGHDCCVYSNPELSGASDLEGNETTHLVGIGLSGFFFFPPEIFRVY